MTRPRVINSLVHRVPTIGKPVKGAYDLWVRSRFHRGWKASNAPATEAFTAQPPTLTDVQRRVLTDLQARGIAHAHFDELIGDGALWGRLAAEVGAWANSAEMAERQRAYREGAYRGAIWKEYIVMRHGTNTHPVIGWDDPWLRFGLRPELLDVVNSYLGLLSKVMYVDLWNTFAFDGERPLTGSQQWHRDPDDVRLVKIFLYFTDVDASAGPLHYVPCSRRGERYGALWPQRIPGSNYPPARELERRIPPSEWVVCAHPAGTFVFVDTTGFHMGGRAQSKNRVFATWEYASQAAFGRYFEPLAPPPAGVPLRDAERFALWHDAGAVAGARPRATRGGRT